jgi:hypothetical protein
MPRSRKERWRFIRTWLKERGHPKPTLEVLRRYAFSSNTLPYMRDDMIEMLTAQVVVEKVRQEKLIDRLAGDRGRVEMRVAVEGHFDSVHISETLLAVRKGKSVEVPTPRANTEFAWEVGRVSMLTRSKLRAEFGKEESVGHWRPEGRQLQRLIVYSRKPLGRAYGPEKEEQGLVESLALQGLSLSDSEVFRDEDGMWAVVQIPGLAGDVSDVVRHEILFRQLAHTTPCRLRHMTQE